MLEIAHNNLNSSADFLSISRGFKQKPYLHFLVMKNTWRNNWKMVMPHKWNLGDCKDVVPHEEKPKYKGWLFFFFFFCKHKPFNWFLPFSAYKHGILFMIVSDSGSSGVAFGQFQFSLKKREKAEAINLWVKILESQQSRE